jgi:hypothetical protein
MPTLRNNSLVPVIAPLISAKGLGQAHGMNFPMSLRTLLDKRDKSPSRVMRIGLCFTTPIGAARSATMNDWWFERLFVDIDGVAAFFREMSGGRRYIEWEIFERPLLTPQQKANADANGSTVAAYRAAAMSAGIPVGNFDRFIWVIDVNFPNSGTAPSDVLATSLDFSPILAEHELTHVLGVDSHADQTVYDDYNDPFCVMGQDTVARDFVNERLSAPNTTFENGTDGPGLCAPYLYAAGWLDYGANVEGIPRSDLAQNTGAALISISANQGAPPPGSPQKIALALGDLPSGTSDPAQYWIEYRHPSRFDRRINIPSKAAAPDLPVEGVVVLHEVSYIPGGRPDLHSYVRDWVGARSNKRLNVPALGVAVRVVQVNVAQRGVILTIDPLI